MKNLRAVEKHDDNKQLQQIANHLYQKCFHHKLHCIVTFDNTLDDDDLVGDTFYSWYFDHKPHIFIYPYNAKNYGNHMAIDIIKHELTHYYLYKTHDNLGTGHNAHFHQISRQINNKDSGRCVPWSLKYPICRYHFKKFYHRPIYFYYSYKMGIYWEYYRLYYGEHVIDQYDKKRVAHYLGMLPMYSVIYAMKHAKQIVHTHSNFTTSQMVSKLTDYINTLANKKYNLYVHKYSVKELRQDHKIASKRSHRTQFAHAFAKAVDNKNTSKVQKIVNKLYRKYFHHQSHCNVVLYVSCASPKFAVRHNRAHIYMGIIGEMSYDGTYDSENAKNDIPKLKLCLLHYYLWSTHDKQGYKHSQRFYQLARDKFNLILQPQKKPVKVVQSPRADLRNIYYSYRLGLWWSSNFIDTDYHYVQFNNHKPEKAYYLTDCHIAKEYNYYTKRLHKKLKHYQKLHFSSAQIADHLTKDCHQLDCEYYHIES